MYFDNEYDRLLFMNTRLGQMMWLAPFGPSAQVNIPDTNFTYDVSDDSIEVDSDNGESETPTSQISTTVNDDWDISSVGTSVTNICPGDQILAIADYHIPSVGYLIVSSGDLIHVLYVGNDGDEEDWLYADNLHSNQRGWMPLFAVVLR